ncbi:hypothetical protein R1flu_019175 [Riccia fluitans]|uniref:Uncharacterized protein n=1 Tax=Riccia fluitans TaxID=41844 RepID=A0ABD1ZHX2_9MARC
MQFHPQGIEELYLKFVSVDPPYSRRVLSARVPLGTVLPSPALENQRFQTRVPVPLTCPLRPECRLPIGSGLSLLLQDLVSGNLAPSTGDFAPPANSGVPGSKVPLIPICTAHRSWISLAQL